MVNVAKPEVKKSVSKISPAVILTAIAVLSVGIALVAIFVLAAWAEASLFGHGVQHVMIFLAGLGFGTSMVGVYQVKGKKNES